MITRTRRARPTTPSTARHPADTPQRATLPTPCAPGMPHNAGDNISISISGDDADELRGYWEKLAAAGEVSMPLEKQVWGDEFGLLKDQFGIHWMVNISQSTAS
jgi:PhnB protein